jgi:catechol-2,3-dioxygenase
MYINELRLYTNNLEKQRDFYTRILEIPLHDAGDDWFTLNIGESTLTFTALEKPAPAYHHFAFNVPEHLFAEAKAWLKSRVKLLKSPEGQTVFSFESWNAHAIYFADPEGNIGEFIARHDIPSSQKSPFDSSSLLSVSEIGLALDDVPGFAKMLQKQIGCPLYHITFNEMFMSMGDEHGLFILVKLGRGWYPDNTMPAIDAPLEVKFSTRGGANFRIEGPPYRIIPV